ncbi:MAG: type III polyketide synthase [Deltaproteobacteria bacterium]|nr:type III polyketide synthase [Deltaproteobacteria bacterium]
MLGAASIWLESHPAQFQLFERFHRASRTKQRSYVIPLTEILKLDGQADRAQKFAEHGLPLACRAVEAALEQAECKPYDIGTVIFTSCTAPLIPSLDVTVLQHMGFSPGVRRIPMYQQGCAGGVVGLGLANRLSASGEKVLLLSVELCSLLFRLRESDGVHLLGSALFADGAAASVVAPQGGVLKFIASQSHLIPESTHLMGYQIRDDGAHLLLDRELPSALQGVFGEVVTRFLSENSVGAADIPWWVIHPGGVRILEGIASLLELRPEQYSWSYDILSSLGNVSSATVQFVLSESLQSKSLRPGDKLVMVGIGPGLTVELILFEYAN